MLRSVWDAIKDDYVAEVNKITVGDGGLQQLPRRRHRQEGLDITGYIDCRRQPRL